jgi:hypothetical protein
MEIDAFLGKSIEVRNVERRSSQHRKTVRGRLDIISKQLASEMATTR